MRLWCEHMKVTRRTFKASQGCVMLQFNEAADRPAKHSGKSANRKQNIGQGEGPGR